MNELGLSLIQVGDRRREDYGDIKALADSIRTYGLLHPIVVDADGNLVAGGRRLEAARSLGWISIPVQQLGELTEDELRAIELEENLQRKDLTAIERSRIMVALAEVTETRSESEQVSRNGSRGPAPDPTSLRSVAEKIGVSPGTIIAAREHVAAVEEFPELEPLPQATAIQQARERRPLPPVSEEAREKQRRWAATMNVLDGLAHFDRDPVPEQAEAEAALIDEAAAASRGQAVTSERLRTASAWTALLADALDRRKT